MSQKQWVWYNKDMYRQMTMSVPSDELGRVRKKKKILAPIERIVSRKKWVPLIQQYYYKGERGKNLYSLEAMMRLYLLQNLYDLSDEATAAEAIDSRAFSRCLRCGFQHCGAQWGCL